MTSSNDVYIYIHNAYIGKDVLAQYTNILNRYRVKKIKCSIYIHIYMWMYIKKTKHSYTRKRQQ